MFYDDDTIETEYTEDDIEPCDDDAYVTTCYDYLSVSAGGKWIANVQSHDEAEELIRDWMRTNQYYPSVWSVSDHGNVHAYGFDYAGII
jgi:hypothetical protein